MQFYTTPKDGELYHWKYIKKERINGKWRYYYNDEDSLYDKGSTNTSDVTTTTTYKNGSGLLDTKTINARVGLETKSGSKTTVIKYEDVIKERGKISQYIDKGKDMVEKILYGTTSYDKYDDNKVEISRNKTTTTYKNSNDLFSYKTKVSDLKSGTKVTKERGILSQIIDKGINYVETKIYKKYYANK